MLCKDVVENIMDYIDSELDYNTLEALEGQCGEFPEGKSFANTYKRMLELSGKLKEKTFVTPEIRSRLKNFLRTQLKN